MDSKLNEGTNSTTKLAASPHEKQAIPENKTLVSSDTQKSALQILVVDDEANLVQVLARILEALGHSVTSALSGHEALEILEANPQGFDIIFTDLSIPDMMGWDVAQAARKICPGLFIILVTGWGADLDPEMIIKYEIDLVINKPYRVRDLQAALDSR